MTNMQNRQYQTYQPSHLNPASLFDANIQSEQNQMKATDLQVYILDEEGRETVVTPDMINAALSALRAAC